MLRKGGRGKEPRRVKKGAKARTSTHDLFNIYFMITRREFPSKKYTRDQHRGKHFKNIPRQIKKKHKPGGKYYNNTPYKLDILSKERSYYLEMPPATPKGENSMGKPTYAP